MVKPYPPEPRANVLAVAGTGDPTPAAVAREFGIPETALKHSAKRGEADEPGSGASEPDPEVVREFRAKVRRLEEKDLVLR